MSNLHKFACPHGYKSMNKCLLCLNKVVDDLEETNEWGGWEDLPYETGNPPKIVLIKDVTT